MKEAEAEFEIEDVLSSIRRLVSQDNRPTRVRRVAFRQSAAAMEPAPVPVPSLEEECLVLTEAQRIAPEQADIVAELSRLETSIAEMEASVAEREPTMEAPAVSDPEATQETLDAAEAGFADAAQYEEDIDQFESAEAEAEICEDIPEQLDAGSQEAAATDSEEDTLLDKEPRECVVDAVPVMETPQAEVDGIPNEAGISIEQNLSEAETPPRLTPQIVRPDRFRQTKSQASPEPSQFFDGNIHDAFDEEALRMLVAQLIREELRGVLGERITHNVRKLVRREIQRALADHDIE